MSNITQELISVGCVQYGEFTLKSGEKSNIYVDLRIVPSFPSLFKTISNQLTSLINLQNIQFDFICGIPFGGLSYATAIAMNLNKPTLLVRKEIKSHGTKKQIEGVYKKGQNVILIEDVITSGKSILEVAEILKNEGLNVIHAFVILNREGGGEENLKEIKLNSLIKLKDLELKKERNEKSYLERSKMTKSSIAKKIFEIMEEKKSNLALSIDVTKQKELLDIVEQCGSEICLLKTHIDILEDFDENFIEKLITLSKKYNFLILEDRKFADIGNVVKQQYKDGIYHICSWSDLVTVHVISGPGVIDGLKECFNNQPKGLLLIASMSSSGNLYDNSMTSSILNMAKENSESVAGFICQNRVDQDDGFLYCTPGVSLSSKSDSLGQNYNSVEHVILNKGTDLIIVGREEEEIPKKKEKPKVYKDEIDIIRAQMSDYQIPSSYDSLEKASFEDVQHVDSPTETTPVKSNLKPNQVQDVKTSSFREDKVVYKDELTFIKEQFSVDSPQRSKSMDISEASITPVKSPPPKKTRTNSIIQFVNFGSKLETTTVEDTNVIKKTHSAREELKIYKDESAFIKEQYSPQQIQKVENSGSSADFNIETSKTEETITITASQIKRSPREETLSKSPRDPSQRGSLSTTPTKKKSSLGTSFMGLFGTKKRYSAVDKLKPDEEPQPKKKEQIIFKDEMDFIREQLKAEQQDRELVRKAIEEEKKRKELELEIKEKEARLQQILKAEGIDHEKKRMEKLKKLGGFSDADIVQSTSKNKQKNEAHEELHRLQAVKIKLEKEKEALAKKIQRGTVQLQEFKLYEETPSEMFGPRSDDESEIVNVEVAKKNLIDDSKDTHSDDLISSTTTFKDDDEIRKLAEENRLLEEENRLLEEEEKRIEEERIRLEEKKRKIKERLEQQKREKERLRLEEEKLLEAERLLLEEEERIEQEKRNEEIEKNRLKNERIAEEKLEAERIAEEQLETERIAEEKRKEEEETLRLETEKLAEQNEEEELKRKEEERIAEEERVRLEEQEKELEKIRLEEEEKSHLEEERIRLENERIAEEERVHAEEEDRIRLENEKLEEEQKEKERLEEEKLNLEKEQERIHIEQEKENERIRLNAEKEQEKLAEEKKETDKLEAKKQEEKRKEEIEKDRLEAERLTEEKLKEERLTEEKKETEKIAEEEEETLRLETEKLSKQDEEELTNQSEPPEEQEKEKEPLNEETIPHQIEKPSSLDLSIPIDSEVSSEPSISDFLGSPKYTEVISPKNTQTSPQLHSTNNQVDTIEFSLSKSDRVSFTPKSDPKTNPNWKKLDFGKPKEVSPEKPKFNNKLSPDGNKEDGKPEWMLKKLRKSPSTLTREKEKEKEEDNRPEWLKKKLGSNTNLKISPRKISPKEQEDTKPEWMKIRLAATTPKKPE
eukprot:gene3972-7228_t